VGGSNFVTTPSAYATDTVCELWNESKPQKLCSHYAKSFCQGASERLLSMLRLGNSPANVEIDFVPVVSGPGWVVRRYKP
jgi:hypothetical protein